MRTRLKPGFSNQVSGGIDRFSDCRKNALTKNRKGIISNKREAAVNFFALVLKDFMLKVFMKLGHSAGCTISDLQSKFIPSAQLCQNRCAYKLSREGFIYDEVNDRYTCKRGVHLPFKKLTTTSLGYKMKVYRSSARDCGPCPLRSVCIGKSDFKKIDDSIDKPYYDRMHARLESVNRNKIKKIRSSTVEPVPGTLVNYLSMGRVNTRGIGQANKCMLMAAVAYNLKKLMKWNEQKRKTAVMGLKKAEKSLCFFVFKLWHCMQTYNHPQINFAFERS